MRLRSVHVSILVLLAIFGTVAATSIAGVWATKGGGGQGSTGGGRFAGQHGPADSLHTLEGTTEEEMHEGETETGVVKGRTTFAIAHRLSTLRNADRLMVLKQGELVELGTHEELLALEGEYHKLVQMQKKVAQLKAIDG